MTFVFFFFFFQAEDGIRDVAVTGVQTCALPISHAVVQGLDAVPPAEWPNVPAVYVSFRVMVAVGTYLALVALWAGWLAWRRADLAHNRWLPRAVALATPMGFVAVEAGGVGHRFGAPP